MSSLLHRGPHPVVGRLSPYMPGDWFECFQTDTMHGLTLVRDHRVDFLVIDSFVSGQGDCGRFLGECMAAYDVVGVWEILNPVLAAMLARRGFVPAVDVFQGETITGMMWNRPAADA